MSNRDTIFALSSGGLPSGVAVIRLSGRQAFSIGTSLVRDLPPPRLSSLRTIRTRNGDILDQGIVIPFLDPHPSRAKIAWNCISTVAVQR